MGNHRGSGRDKEPAGACAIAVRALAAGAVVAASLFAVGFLGAPFDKPDQSASLVGSGQVGTGQVGTGQVGMPGLAGGFLTDGRALVPFNRTLVWTIAKGGSAPLNVASAGLSRPPEGSLMAPLELLASSSPFGYRVSPLTGTGGDFHLGQDFAAGCGTRVYSADAGVVRAAGWHPWGGGNRVEIDHGNGLITTYNHLEAVAVRTGDSVQVGQVIARVGTTGWSTGCHLHFETILHGKHTSPLNWMLLRIRQLDELGDIVMVSHAAKDDAEAQRWAIPVADDHSHTVLGGEEELSEAPDPGGTLPGPEQQDEAPTKEPSSEATAPGSASADPTATETATETATSTASPSPTGSAPSTSVSPTPTGTSSNTASPTPTGTSSNTASPTPTGSAPSTSVSPTPTGTSTGSASPTGTSNDPTTAPTPTGTASSPATTASPSPTPTSSSTRPFRPTSRTPTPAPVTDPATTDSESSADTASASPTATASATPTASATRSKPTGR